LRGSRRRQPYDQLAQRLATRRTLHLLGLGGEATRSLELASLEGPARVLTQSPGSHGEPHQRREIRPATGAHPRTPKACLTHRTVGHGCPSTKNSSSSSARDACCSVSASPDARAPSICSLRSIVSSRSSSCIRPRSRRDR